MAEFKAVSNKYLIDFASKGILPSFKKQSNTMMMLPGTGRGSIHRFVMDNKKKVSKLVGVDLSQIVVLLSDETSEEETLMQWKLLLIKQKVINVVDSRVSWSGLEEIIYYLTASKKLRVLISCLIDVNKWNWQRVEKLRKINTMQVDLQFCVLSEIGKNSDYKEIFGGLVQFASQNVWYLPLYKEVDIDEVIETQERQGLVKIANRERDLVRRLSGGHAGLARFYLRNLDKLDDQSYKYLEVERLLNGIWDCLSLETQEKLFLLIQKREVSGWSDFALRTGLIIEKNRGTEIFSKVFEGYVGHLLNEGLPRIIEKEKELFLFGRKLTLLLSAQEESVFRLLWDKKGDLIERDKIAQVVWDHDWEERYSDWAIDQVISRIRRKIGDRGKKRLIEVVKGKGFIIKK